MRVRVCVRRAVEVVRKSTHKQGIVLCHVCCAVLPTKQTWVAVGLLGGRGEGAAGVPYRALLAYCRAGLPGLTPLPLPLGVQHRWVTHVTVAGCREEGLRPTTSLFVGCCLSRWTFFYVLHAAR